MYPQLIFIAICGVALLRSAASFSYHDQEAWKDESSVCGSGRKQSPIDIDTANVQREASLSDLQFDAGWTVSRSGETKNSGQTARFDPDVMDTITTTPGGDYRLAQFHFHWGRNANEGSEHTVDGSAFSGELHFVHKLVSNESYFGVIGVFLEADSDLQITGSPWGNFIVPLNITAGPIDVTDIVYSDFLPEDRGYYHYEGSFTTPLCNEVVEWYVMKQSIKVPSEFLAMLRKLPEEDGDHGGFVKHNFRDTQALNGRVVMTGGSRAVSAIFFFLLLLVSACAAVF